MIVLLTLGVGCSGDTKGAQASVAATLEACALLQKADVDAAFAPRVFRLEPENGPDIVGNARMAAVSHCTYASPGASALQMMTVGLVVRQAQTDASGVTVATARAGAVKLNATPAKLKKVAESALARL